MTQNSPFEFVDQVIEGAARSAHVAHVKANIASKEELLRTLYESLQLPGYFGFNWDALSDCLRDLHWLEPRTVMLVHTDLPRLPKPELQTYLEILAEAAQSWRPDEKHELRVIFPIESSTAVASALSS